MNLGEFREILYKVVEEAAAYITLKEATEPGVMGGGHTGVGVVVRFRNSIFQRLSIPDSENMNRERDQIELDLTELLRVGNELFQESKTNPRNRGMGPAKLTDLWMRIQTDLRKEGVELPNLEGMGRTGWERK